MGAGVARRSRAVSVRAVLVGSLAWTPLVAAHMCRYGRVAFTLGNR